MKLLLDSHYAFWWQTGNPRLTPMAQRFIASAESVAVSHATVWEFAIKAGLGRIQIDLPVFAAQVEALGFEWLPIRIEHLLELRQLEAIEGHRDPFDRLLIAQSRVSLRTLVTADAKLSTYGDLVHVL
jgi:PIN domain nuclease of toxin-antitoxin system